MDLTPESTVRVRWLIALTVAVNALVLFFPAVLSDAATYGLIAKEMALTGDWVNLRYEGQDWLDKPHFPFWLTALSFRVFGVNGFAYVLPGLLFHFLGAWFTYRLAKHFYGRATGLLAALFTLTACRLLWATADVRAEVYLLAGVVGACWFWVRYDEEGRARDLVGGAAFTALALMTKGLFVLLVIGGGLACEWIRRGSWRELVRPKWLLALALSFVFALPELVALYVQFDLHPEKQVFGQTGVSGLRFFFWDSQFGRFFNTGPITNTTGHPLNFVPTFLWGFLPWTVLALSAAVHAVRERKRLPPQERRPLVILSMSFALPFVLFSLTAFQLDHYLDILLPFAAILAARFFLEWLPTLPFGRWIHRVQVLVALVLAAFVLGVSWFAFRGTGWLAIAALPLAVLVLAFVWRRTPLPVRAVVLPVLAANAFFVFFVPANRLYFERYDAGHQVAVFLEGQPRLPLYDYRARAKSLTFQAAQNAQYVERLEAVGPPGPDVFIVVDDERVDEVLRAFPGASVVARASGTRSNRLPPRLLLAARGHPPPSMIHLSLVRTGTGR